MQRFIKILIGFLGIIGLASLGYFFIGWANEADAISWGVDFSQAQAAALGLDWRAAYGAMLDDLGVRRVKLHTHWNLLELSPGKYAFDDTDWQIKEAEKRDAEVIYVLGLKTGRWPECHAPEWAMGLSESDQQEAILAYMKAAVERYKGSLAVKYWQVENEPLFWFGECPAWYYGSQDFLKRQVALVRQLDPSRRIIISDSGELSLWHDAARIGDIVGVTTYRRAWVNLSSFGLPIQNPGFYGSYPIPPVYYQRKAQLVEWLYGKNVIGVELQAEPWAYQPFYDISLEEQAKTMDLNRLKQHVAYAKKTGLDTFYFWGVEWWYWLKETQGMPQIWNYAKTIFTE